VLFRRIQKYLIALVPWLVGAALYGMLVVPWLEPYREWSDPVHPVVQREKQTPWWSRYFQPGDWQLGEATVLETERGVLLFRDRKEVGDHILQLSPLTLVLPRGTSHGGGGEPSEVLLIECDQGAEFEFAGRLDPLKGAPPPLVGGMLRGLIRMRSIHPSGQSLSNIGQSLSNMLIQTRDVHIDARTLWTSQTVQIQLGDSQIEGRELLIELDKELLSEPADASGASSSPFQGFKSLSLQYLDRAWIRLPNGGLLGSSPSHPTAAPNVANLPPAHLSIGCKRVFQYNFLRNVATMDGGVTIEHQVEGMRPDRFSCDQLAIHLNVTSDPVAAKDPQAAAWQVRLVEAIGKDTDDEEEDHYWVLLHAPDQQYRLQARSLRWDQTAGKIEVSNGLPGNRFPASIPAYLQMKQLEIWSEQLDFQNDALDVSSNRSLDRLGNLNAKGPGKCIAKIDPDATWQLEWTQSLQLAPDGPVDWLSIQGEAKAGHTTQGSFSAERIDLWISKQESAPGNAAPQGKLAVGFRPQRMVAERGVVLHTAKLQAQVDRLESWFDYQEAAPIAVAPTAPNPPGNGPAFPTRPIDSAATTPAPSAPAAGGNSANDPPLQVLGRLLRTHMVQAPGQTWVQDLELEGDVTLLRAAGAGSAAWPLRVSGDAMQMEMLDQLFYDIRISGKPATIAVGEGMLQGPQLRMNQKEQQIWMDSPGHFALPPEFLKTSEASSPAGMVWMEVPQVSWSGRMVFNGETARLEGDVQWHGKVQRPEGDTWTLSGRSQQLDLVLGQPLAWDLKTPQTATLSKMILRSDVQVYALQEDRFGHLQSTHHLALPEIQFDLVQQTFQGRGPGGIRSHAQNLSQDRSTTPAVAALSSPSSEAALLQCLHLTFAQAMQGRMLRAAGGNQMDVTFLQNVHALQGSVSNWNDALDLHQLTALSPGQSIITADQLRIYSTGDLNSNQPPGLPRLVSTPPAAGFWELEANGNVTAESIPSQGRVKVMAQRAQYVLHQDRLRIEGMPQRPAVIWMTDPKLPAGAPAEFQVRFAEVNVRTLEYGAMELVSASAGTRDDGAQRTPATGTTGTGAWGPPLPPGPPPSSNLPAGPFPGSSSGNLPNPRELFPGRQGGR
jgi:hypothetical protein